MQPANEILFLANPLNEIFRLHDMAFNKIQQSEIKHRYLYELHVSQQRHTAGRRKINIMSRILYNM
jgi:hypothetical protein